MEIREYLRDLAAQRNEMAATGLAGVQDYRAWAKQQGYNYIEPLQTSATSGDWEFLVSQDGSVWFVMMQANNYPRPGFTRMIDESRPYYGTARQAAQQIENQYYQRW